MACSSAGNRERRTFTTTSLPLMVTVVFSGTWMVCFPIRDILAVVCTVERLTGAVRGFARLNLAVVANMLCGSVDCCGDDAGEGIHQRGDTRTEQSNYVHNARGSTSRRCLNSHAAVRCPLSAVLPTHRLITHHRRHTHSLYTLRALNTSLEEMC